MKKIKVFKIGGKVVNSEELLTTFLKGITECQGPKVIIHGGGSKASQIMKSMGIEPNMVEGRRITDAPTLEIVTMVYAGLINKNMVARLQANGVNAIGVSGADMNAIQSHKRIVKDIDYGYVGDIDQVNGPAILKLCEGGFIPVFCPITHDMHGQLLNTNADTIAAQVAIALAQIVDVELKYCFELNGVLKDVKDKDSVISEMNEAMMTKLYDDGVIHTGMIPKLKNGFDAVKGGVSEVNICHISALNDEEEGTRLV